MIVALPPVEKLELSEGVAGHATPYAWGSSEGQEPATSPDYSGVVSAVPVVHQPLTVDVVSEPASLDMRIPTTAGKESPCQAAAESRGVGVSPGTPQHKRAALLRLVHDPTSVSPVVSALDGDGNASCVWCGAPIHPVALTCRSYHKQRLSRLRKRARALFLEDDASPVLWVASLPPSMCRAWGRAFAEQWRRSGQESAQAGGPVAAIVAASVAALLAGDWRGVLWLALAQEGDTSGALGPCVVHALGGAR